MNKGLKYGKTPTPGKSELGKAMLQIVGVGLAAGIALIAATDKIMKGKKEEGND